MPSISTHFRLAFFLFKPLAFSIYAPPLSQCLVFLFPCLLQRSLLDERSLGAKISSSLDNREIREETSSRDMYSAYVLLLLLFFIVPQRALAVDSEKQYTEKVAMTALKHVGNNAYLNYNKNIHIMKHHSKQIAAISKAMNENREASMDQILAASMDTLVGKLPTTDAFEVSRDLLQWMNMGQQEIQKHKDHFERASFAAGKQFRTNRLLHAVMPKEIKPAENTPKKALLLVAQNAWKKSGPDAMLLHKLNTERQTLRQRKKSGKSIDQARLMRLQD